jgi:hypothetical protein
VGQSEDLQPVDSGGKLLSEQIILVVTATQITGGGKQSQVEGSNSRWRGAIDSS